MTALVTQNSESSIMIMNMDDWKEGGLGLAAKIRRVGSSSKNSCTKWRMTRPLVGDESAWMSNAGPAKASCGIRVRVFAFEEEDPTKGGWWDLPDIEIGFRIKQKASGERVKLLAKNDEREKYHRIYATVRKSENTGRGPKDQSNFERGEGRAGEI